MSNVYQPMDEKEGYPYVKGIPLLLGTIKPDQDINKIVITNAEWWRLRLPAPPLETAKIADFVFVARDDVWNVEGNFEYDGDVNDMSLGDMVRILQGALNALWRGEINGIRIHNLPGLTLLDFVDPLPEEGTNMQWEQADLEKIILTLEMLAKDKQH